MQVAFAIIFFIFVGVCETLRHGVFGLNPSNTPIIIYGILTLAALLLLRSDLIQTMHCPKDPLYGSERLNWTWPRTVLGIFLGPLIWTVPVAYGFALIQINVNPIAVDGLLQVFLGQALLVVIAESLFFREAVIKAFGRHILPAYVISVLALFIFYVPVGVPEALIAAGSGIYYLTLRLIGTNIWAVALLHGATLILFGEVLSLGLTQSQLWSYSVYYVSASAALSVLIFMLFATSSKEARYA